MEFNREKKVLGVRSIIFWIGFVSLLTDMSSEMIVPILPLFLTSVLHTQIGTIGIIEGIAESTASVLKLFSGWFSDQIGKRKPLMIIGYGLSNLIKPFFAITTSGWQVLFIRFGDRFGKGMRGAPRDALIADATTKEDRGKAFGFHRAMDTLGAVIGPLVAFIILNTYHGQYRTIFVLSAIPGVLAIFVLIFFLKEKKKDENSEQRGLPKISLKQMGRKFVVFTLISTLFALGNSSDAFLILQTKEVGMKDTLIPLAYLVFNLTYTFFSLPTGILSDRIGRRPVIISGYVIFAIIYLGFGLVHHPLGIWILFVFYGLYYAATEGIQKAYIADLVPMGNRGTAMGTFNAFTGFAALPASIIAGSLWQAFGPLATFATSSGLAILAAILLFIIKE
ncbi:MFS transporter [Neobacillus sp. PS3-40]|uniref:MFS transporter n=1 Tax=Neobacillus sp. PS3-40 TaxID=3070679 RepID=UPI0027E0CCCB|nr:MFS transporter [Neobacillus sp. PS3-40]WML44883.1 MFS transporter [Neobacillus sp. PS3-40]